MTELGWGGGEGRIQEMRERELKAVKKKELIWVIFGNLWANEWTNKKEVAAL